MPTIPAAPPAVPVTTFATTLGTALTEAAASKPMDNLPVK